MINLLIIAIKFIFLLGFLIFIHEGGHFIVAKLCKVTVLNFSIGFGPIIFKKKAKETLYTIRLIPLGGFVKLEGEEEASNNEGSFSNKTIPQKIAVVIAGGSINIIFGLIVYFILVASTNTYISNIVDNVEVNSGAQIAGIMPEDEILKVNNKAIHLRSDLKKALDEANGKELEVQLKRNNEIININVLPKEEKEKNTGIYFGAEDEKITAQIKAVYPGSPAEQAGIKKGDIIKKINGEKVDNNAYKAIKIINNSQDEKISFNINRNGEEFIVYVIPDIYSTYYLGITLKEVPKTFWLSIKYGFCDTLDFSASIVDNLKLLFSGKVSANQLMGPIGISTMVADTNGFVEFIYLLALISLSLGVTNLLPIPPLDGWKVVEYLIELIRRKPMNDKLRINIEMLGFAFMIVLSIYVAYNDILRI